MRNFHFAGRSTVHAQNGMVATSHPLAALAGIEVLKAGGTAADAAVAACALLGVIEPQSTGIGGDCFALIQPRGEGKIVAYNGSGRAPAAATVDWYLERKIHSVPLTSAHAVSIPGSVDAWEVILRDHGKFGARHPAAARDQGGGRGLCRRPAHRLRLEEPVREAEERHQHRALSAAARQARGGRRRASVSPSSARRCARSPRTAATPSTRARSPKTWSRRCAASAACTRSRISPSTPPRHLADRHDVQGPRRLAVPAERARHHHAGDAQHPLALRSARNSRRSASSASISRPRPRASPT